MRSAKQVGGGRGAGEARGGDGGGGSLAARLAEVAQ